MPGAQAAEFAEQCGPPPTSPDGAVTVVVGQVSCQRFKSEHLGATSAFGYYVPPPCAPATGRRCPVVYLLHGTGSSYRSLLGSATNPSAYVRALTSGPPVDTRTVSDPWNYASPGDWVPKEPLDFILVTPQNQTVPGGYGPEPGLDGLWTDWNPRYALGGDQQKYDTPPPRFASQVVDEVIPFVEQYFPAGTGRDWRVVEGRSQGGFGAIKLGLEYPDVFASAGAVSGGSIPPGYLASLPASPASGTAPLGEVLPYTPIPGVYPKVGGFSTGEPATTAIVASFALAWGDPVADSAQWRSGQPSTYVTNARAYGTGGQAQHLRFIVNDAVPRRVEDLTSDRYHYDEFYEAGALALTVELRRAFDAAGVAYTFELNPGLHSSAYSNPHLRRMLEDHWANVRHPDGSGDPPPFATVFDYRSIWPEFSAWGWDFRVDRAAREFLDLTGVSCDGLTLQGSGQVTVTVPEACGTGLAGARTFVVDLGAPTPTDQPIGSTPLPGYGTVQRVELAPL